MSLLAALATDKSIEQETDNVGSSVLDSGIYKSVVETAYITKSDGGALGLVCNFKSNNRSIRQTFWMTSGTAKGCKNYYEAKTGEKKYLPGFLQANALALLITGKEIAAIEPEDKVVKLYNKEVKAEIPTKVQMLTDLCGQEIIIGLIKQTVDKTAKADDGTYQPTGETKDENEVDKLFRASDNKTTQEIRDQVDAKFIETWNKKWAGQVKNKAKGLTAGGSIAGAPKAAVSSKPKVSLFA